jgi:hypothetical protein
LTEGGVRSDQAKRVSFVCWANVLCSGVTDATSGARAEDGGLALRAASAAIGPLAGEDAAANVQSPRGGRYPQPEAPRGE